MRKMWLVFSALNKNLSFTSDVVKMKHPRIPPANITNLTQAQNGTKRIAKADGLIAPSGWLGPTMMRSTRSRYPTCDQRPGRGGGAGSSNQRGKGRLVEVRIKKMHKKGICFQQPMFGQEILGHILWGLGQFNRWLIDSPLDPKTESSSLLVVSNWGGLSRALHSEMLCPLGHLAKTNLPQSTPTSRVHLSRGLSA